VKWFTHIFGDTSTDNSIPDSFALIRGGEFMMGSPVHEINRLNWETQHHVRVSDFYMCKHAVTVAEFRKFAEATGSFSVTTSNDTVKTAGVNWRHGALGGIRPQAEDNHPVLHVSWNDAVAYCNWLSINTQKPFRLPTEAEWEYACRAGTTTPFNTGENLLPNQANYNGNEFIKDEPGLFRKNTCAVNSFAPNALGLYNMHGNVFEWCSDWFGVNYYDECKASGTVTNPAGPATGSNRVLRGGSWGIDVEYCRSAYRIYRTPDNRRSNIGFRLVFTR